MPEFPSVPLPKSAYALFAALGGLFAVQFLALLPVVATGPRSSLVLYLATSAGICLLIAWVATLARRPLRYRVEGDVLVVPAHFAAVRVPLRGARVSTGPLSGWKLSGTAVPPFCLGLFVDAEGRYHAAATAYEGVWVRGERRVYVTPADVPGFLAAVAAAGASVV